MSLKILLVLVLLLLVAVFSVQNAGVITVRFLAWQFALSQALVILLAAFCGAVVGLAVGAWGGRDRARRKSAEPPPPPVP